MADSLADSDPALLVNKEFAINCLRANWSTLKYFPTFQDDIDVVSQAVAIDGRAIQFASPRLKQDRALVLSAIRQNSQALFFIDDVLKNDEPIVRVAMERYPQAILYTTDLFKTQHPELVRHAMLRDSSILYHLPIVYQRDISILQLIPPEQRTPEQKRLLREGTDVFNVVRRLQHPPRVALHVQRMLGTNPKLGGTKRNKKRNRKSRKK